MSSNPSIDVSFQASAANDEDSFCATDSGCALYGFYIEEDDNDGDADLDFATSCQALGTGTLAYENIITTESTATLATSSFTTSVCIEFPQKVCAERTGVRCDVFLCEVVRLLPKMLVA